MTNLPVIEDIDGFLSTVDGTVSFLTRWSRTTATVEGGRWTSKQFATDYLNKLLFQERALADQLRRQSYVAPIATGERAEPYTGPFPRKRHSHKCLKCEERGQYNSVACYKSKCTKAQLVSTCEWCR